MTSHVGFQPRPPSSFPATSSLACAAIWMLGFVTMTWLHSSLGVDLINLTVVLIFTSAVASVFAGPMVAAVLSLCASLLFNMLFVPPLGDFRLHFDAHEEFVLVGALAISQLVGLLTARLRRSSQVAEERARQLHVLNDLGMALREDADHALAIGALHNTMAAALSGRLVLAMKSSAQPPAPSDSAMAIELAGEASVTEMEWLEQTLTHGRPVTDDQLDAFFPINDQSGVCGGALWWPGSTDSAISDERVLVQAMCDLVGLAWERAHIAREANETRELSYRRELSNLVLSAVSHEYRTPLATILSSASTLRLQGERLPSDERQRMLGHIVDEVEHLRRITSNMLQLARLDAKDSPLQIDWESVEDLVGSVLHRMHARDSHWKITTEMEPRLPLIRCDAVLISQVIENLLDNARRYAGPQPPTIVAWTSEHWLHIAVRDRGPGIDAALQSKLFKAFERGKVPMSARPTAGGTDGTSGFRRGSGVGLALCQAIMRAHGGDVQWYAREGGGCSFECSMPLSSELSISPPKRSSWD